MTKYVSICPDDETCPKEGKIESLEGQVDRLMQAVQYWIDQDGAYVPYVVRDTMNWIRKQQGE